MISIHHIKLFSGLSLLLLLSGCLFWPQLMSLKHQKREIIVLEKEHQHQKKMMRLLQEKNKKLRTSLQPQTTLLSQFEEADHRLSINNLIKYTKNFPLRTHITTCQEEVPHQNCFQLKAEGGEEALLMLSSDIQLQYGLTYITQMHLDQPHSRQRSLTLQLEENDP